MSDEARLTEVQERYRRARDEVARLSQPDDHGSGERTARLAALGAWELALDAARREVEALTGRRIDSDEAPD